MSQFNRVFPDAVGVRKHVPPAVYLALVATTCSGDRALRRAMFPRKTFEDILIIKRGTLDSRFELRPVIISSG
jgi:hypothetical protein